MLRGQYLTFTYTEFIGTSCRVFPLVNLSILIFAMALGITTPQSPTLNLYSLPLILLGALLGIQLLSYINLALLKPSSAQPCWPLPPA